MDSIEKALEEIARGRMVIVVDDESRENEGDLVADALLAAADTVNFMAAHGRGLICVPMEQKNLDELGLPPMTARNRDPHGTAFTVSVDHIESTTGISASERARTIQALANPSSRSSDFRAPGHVFPLAARAGGVLERRGHTEAAVDLVRLARAHAAEASAADPLSAAGASAAANGTAQGRNAGVICEIMNEDGTMARRDDLERFARQHGLAMVSIAELAAWRYERESSVELVASTRLPTEYGVFAMHAFVERATGLEHVALVSGTIDAGSQAGAHAAGESQDDAVLCRVHSECLTGDALGSKRCDCGEQYAAAMRAIGQQGSGVLVYLRQEGRGIGLANKVKAYALQDGGADTVDANLLLGFPADKRNYRAAADILRALGVRSVRLMTNNPAKSEALERFGIRVPERVSAVVRPNPDNERYLATKRDRMHHIIGVN